MGRAIAAGLVATRTRAVISGICTRTNRPEQEREGLEKTHQLLRSEGGVVAYHIVHGNADGERDAPFDGRSVHLLGVQLGSLRYNDLRPKFTDIDYSRPREALTKEASEGEVHDLGRLLVFGANIAAPPDRGGEEVR